MLHFGALDAAIPLDEVAKIGEQYPDVEIHVYEEADHGFNCDARGDVPPGCRRRWRSSARSRSSLAGNGAGT